MKNKLANAIFLTHMAWLVVLCLFPFAYAFGLIGQWHIMDAAIVQFISSAYWKFKCPLTSLEQALRNGDEINKGWIVQPVLTVIAVPVLVELLKCFQ